MSSVSVLDLTVKRGGATLLDGVRFAAGAEDFVGVIGPNGAGKSTLLRAIAGLESAASGAVTIAGAPVDAMASLVRARALAFLPQAREVHWAITAEAVVSLGRFAYGEGRRLGPADRAAVDAALAATDARSFRCRVASTLSGGELARIHVARALATETPILIVDEPTAALDIKHALAVMAALRARAAAGGTVIAALHDLALARRFCTRMIVLNDGRIEADGAPPDSPSDELIARVFGVSADDLDRSSWRKRDTSVRT